jgi:Uma2 family endonuclease
VNAPFRTDQALTQPRKRLFTPTELLAMWESGVFANYPDLELIAGEIIEMPSDGPRTISWNAALNLALARMLPPDAMLVADKTLVISDDLGAPKPDFYIYPLSVKLADLRARDTLLVIEVSDATIAWDRDVKVPAYEKGGVREHWRIECETRQIAVYRLRDDGAYGEPAIVAFDETAEALLVAGLKLRLADLALPE